MYIDKSAGYFKTLGAESDNIEDYRSQDLFHQHYLNKIEGMVKPELIEDAKRMATVYRSEFRDQVIYEFDVKLCAEVTSARWGTTDYSSTITIYTDKP